MERTTLSYEQWYAAASGVIKSVYPEYCPNQVGLNANELVQEFVIYRRFALLNRKMGISDELEALPIYGGVSTNAIEKRCRQMQAIDDEMGSLQTILEKTIQGIGDISKQMGLDRQINE